MSTGTYGGIETSLNAVELENVSYVTTNNETPLTIRINFGENCVLSLTFALG